MSSWSHIWRAAEGHKSLPALAHASGPSNELIISKQFVTCKLEGAETIEAIVASVVTAKSASQIVLEAARQWFKIAGGAKAAVALNPKLCCAGSTGLMLLEPLTAFEVEEALQLAPETGARASVKP